MAKIRQFQWTRKLAVGVPVIDSQHREYFTRVNEALKHADMSESKTLFRQALGFVRSYAVFHFDSEQEVMRVQNCPGFEDHLLQHEYFDGELQRLTETFAADGFSPNLAMELYLLLVDWFVNHIRTVDMQLGCYLKERGVADKL